MPTRPANPMDYLYILGTILFTVYGQLVLKWQMNRVGPLPEAGDDKVAALVRLLFNPWIVSCVVAGFLAMMCWMVALTRFQLTYAYPFVSTTFALVLIAGALLFNEALTLPRAAGVALIMLGVFVGSRG